MTWRLWWQYANKIIQRQSSSRRGWFKRDRSRHRPPTRGGWRVRCLSSESAQMKGRGVDLRDSNGHLLPHLAKGYGPAMKVFQPFRLDTVNHCLWRAEERVRLTPRAFDVLCYPVQPAHRHVTQHELL